MKFNWILWALSDLTKLTADFAIVSFPVKYMEFII